MTRLTLPNPPKIKATNFRLQRVQAMNPMRGGQHQAVDMGEPVWVCDLSTAPLTREGGGYWKALLAKLRGALRTLMLYDASRPYPIAYHDDAPIDAPTGSSTTYYGSSVLILGSATDEIWGWGAPEIVEVDRTNSRVRLINLTPYAELSPGDMGCWDDGPARRLHIVVDAVTADEDGEAWVTIEPAPPASSTSLPSYWEMHKPTGEFVVLQASAAYSAPVIHEVTLQAGQVLRRS